MEADVLRAELERIQSEAELARRAFGEVARALGELWEALEGLEGKTTPSGGRAPHAESDRSGQVVTNVAEAHLAEVRTTLKLGVSVFASSQVSEVSGCAPRGVEEALLRAASQDSLDTASVPRPERRTLPGLANEDRTPTSRVPRPSREALEAAESRFAPESRVGEENPSGEYERPPRETLTYFLGSDDSGTGAGAHGGPEGGEPRGRGGGESK